MTKPLKPTSAMSGPDRKLLEDIERVGWHVISVFSPESDEPEWSFSIGLFQSFRHAEIITFGLPRDRRSAVINSAGRQVQAGKIYQANGEYADILAAPYKCAFRDVPRSLYREYVGYALWFYESDPFPLIQCFWPDKEGLFPWDDQCNEHVRVAQPTLFSF